MKSEITTMAAAETTKKEVMRRDRVVRATALAAYRIFSNCRKHNPERLDIYLSCAFHVIFSIIRLGAPRDVPVPGTINRSAVSKADKRFSDVFHEEYAKLERQAEAGRRPTQPEIVTEAMRMLPSSRGGQGSVRLSEFEKRVPHHLKPIHQIMLEGIDLISMRDLSRRIKKSQATLDKRPVRKKG